MRSGKRSSNLNSNRGPPRTRSNNSNNNNSGDGGGGKRTVHKRRGGGRGGGREGAGSSRNGGMGAFTLGVRWEEPPNNYRDNGYNNNNNNYYGYNGNGYHGVYNGSNYNQGASQNSNGGYNNHYLGYGSYSNPSEYTNDYRQSRTSNMNMNMNNKDSFGRSPCGDGWGGVRGERGGKGGGGNGARAGGRGGGVGGYSGGNNVGGGGGWGARSGPPVPDGVSSMSTNNAHTFTYDIDSRSQTRRTRGGGEGVRYTVNRANTSSNAKYARKRGKVRRQTRSNSNLPKNNIPTNLQEISISKNSIHSSWKKELGSLIRYKIAQASSMATATANNTADAKRAEQEIDDIYYRTGCNVQETKAVLLESLGVSREVQSDLVDIHMAVEIEGLDLESLPIVVVGTDGNFSNGNVGIDEGNNNDNTYQQTIDKKGIKLHTTIQQGEGPAHSHEQWTTILIPSWAVNKSYYFELRNKSSSLHLSCELYLDGVQIAKNAPLPAGDVRTVRPDNGRYFQSHKWILKPAIREKLQTAGAGAGAGGNNNNGGNHDEDMSERNANRGAESTIPSNGVVRRNTPRYNGIRPNYAGQRVPIESYPDPTTFGWIFTGSVEESRVEFFEKVNNLGRVKLDWYYTTGTVKTVLDHPSTGRNALFRAQVSSEQFFDIMKNPRVHTNVGYRRREDRPVGGQAAAGNGGGNVEVDDGVEDEFDRLPFDSQNGEGSGSMETDDGNGSSEGSSAPPNTTYFAKNEGYDFKKQGHANRREEMEKMHHSNAYAKWEEAAKKEYAVIHAKFYMSLPKRTHTAPVSARRNGAGRSQKDRELEPLPEQSKVVDIKAAERATLGTKFEATGPPREARRSTVRMNRINGLKDDPEWKGLPLYEKKLYYRAEEVVKGSGLGYDSDFDDNDSKSDDNEPEHNEEVPLEDYRSEKINQVRNYHEEYMRNCPNPEEGAERLRACMNKIGNSDSKQDIDTSMAMLYGEVTRNEFHGKHARNDDMEC